MVTKEDLKAELEATEHRIINRMLLAMLATAAVIISSVALLTQL